jgi:hypothetical protein
MSGRTEEVAGEEGNRLRSRPLRRDAPRVAPATPPDAQAAAATAADVNRAAGAADQAGVLAAEPVNT